MIPHSKPLSLASLAAQPDSNEVLFTQGFDSFPEAESSDLDIDERSIRSKTAKGSTQVFNCQVDHEGTLVYVKAWRPQTAGFSRGLLIVHDLGKTLAISTNLPANLANSPSPFFAWIYEVMAEQGVCLAMWIPFKPMSQTFFKWPPG